jgi:hypothetical protein
MVSNNLSILAYKSKDGATSLTTIDDGHFRSETDIYDCNLKAKEIVHLLSPISSNNHGCQSFHVVCWPEKSNNFYP